MGKNKIRVIVPECLFFGGDVLCGVVELLVKSKLKSRGIRLLFAGMEHTHWREGSGQNSRSYSETHVFIKHRFDFAGTPRHLRKEKDAQVDIVEPGVYRWPFSIVLPPNLPASVKLSAGYIRYILTAYVDIPFAFDLKKSIVIPVGGELFNRAFYMAPCPPFSLDDKKTFFFASGKLSMTATIPRQNFLAEEAIPIHISVNNGSTKEMNKVKIQLIEHHIFRAEGFYTARTITPKKWKQTLDHYIPKKTEQEIDVVYRLPPGIIPSITNANQDGAGWSVKLVTVTYFLSVRLDIPWAIDLKVVFPINVMTLSPRYPIYFVPQQAPMVYAPPPVPVPQVYAVPPEGQVFGPPPPNYPPAMPVIPDYQYPQDNAAILVELGNHKVDKEDEELLYASVK